MVSPEMLQAWARSIAKRHEANPNIEWQIETGIAGPTMQGPGGATVTAHKVYAPVKLVEVDVEACVLRFKVEAQMQRPTDKRMIQGTLLPDLPLWLVQTMTDMTDMASKLSSPIVAPPRM